MTGNEERNLVKLFRIIEMILLTLLMTVPGWIAILEARNVLIFSYETKRWIYYLLSGISSTGIIYILFTRLRGHTSNEDDILKLVRKTFGEGKARQIKKKRDKRIRKKNDRRMERKNEKKFMEMTNSTRTLEMEISEL